MERAAATAAIHKDQRLILSVAWALENGVFMLVAGSVAVDSLLYWLQFRRDDRELASAYSREVIGDMVILAVLVFGFIVGVLAILNTGHRVVIVDVLIIVGLFSGPAALGSLSIYKYWRRRRLR